MEEEKLLRSLRIFLTVICILTTPKVGASSLMGIERPEDISLYKSKENLEFIRSVLPQVQSAVLEKSKEEIRNFLNLYPGNSIGISEDTLLEEQAKLLIFVSTSMPETLLRDYFREASKCGGILVFKGLPKGSFKELTNLVMRLHGVKNSQNGGGVMKEAFAGAVIDDESFEKFNITRVPSIVLLEENECFEEELCKVSYDKVTGNIGVVGALREFESKGEMKAAANKMLRDFKVGW